MGNNGSLLSRWDAHEELFHSPTWNGRLIRYYTLHGIGKFCAWKMRISTFVKKKKSQNLWKTTTVIWPWVTSFRIQDCERGKSWAQDSNESQSFKVQYHLMRRPLIPRSTPHHSARQNKMSLPWESISQGPSRACAKISRFLKHNWSIY